MIREAAFSAYVQVNAGNITALLSNKAKSCSYKLDRVNSSDGAQDSSRCFILKKLFFCDLLDV